MRYVLGIAGTALLLVAMWMLYAGFSVETTVAAPSGSLLPDGMQGISNLQLMHIQQLDIIIGTAAGLASAVLLAAAAIVGVIQDQKGQIE